MRQYCLVLAVIACACSGNGLQSKPASESPQATPASNEKDGTAPTLDVPETDGGTAPVALADAGTPPPNGPDAGTPAADCPDGQNQCADGCCPWTSITLGGTVAAGVSITTSGTTAHIGYLEQTVGISIATIQGTNKTVQLVEPRITHALDMLELATHSSGEPCMAYANRSMGSWTVKCKVHDLWEGPPLGAAKFSPSALSLTAGDDGHLYAAASDSSQKAFFWGTVDPEGWKLEEVQLGAVYYPALAVSKTGEVDLVYGSFSEGAIVHGRKAPSDMEFKFTDVAPVAGNDRSAIRRDATGRVHLLYSYRGLTYATLGQGSAGWKYTTLTPTAEGMSLGALALNAQGRPRAVFIDAQQRTLHIAIMLADGRWRISNLGSVAAESGFPVISVDASGAAHVAYLDREKGKVVYLR